MVDRSVGPEIADADVMGVIPHSFQRLRILLQRGELAVVDEPSVRQIGEVALIGKLLHRGRTQPYRIVEGIRIEVVICNAVYIPEFLPVHTCETVGQAFCRSGIHGIVISFGIIPVNAEVMHTADDLKGELFAFRIP